MQPRAMSRLLNLSMHMRFGVRCLARATPLRTATRTYSKNVGTNVEVAKACIVAADAVCFDVDSTVITEEGIDVLAASLSPEKGEKVAEYTANAMGGSVPFHVALEARLSIMEPSMQDIEKCMKEHPLEFSPGLESVISILQKKGTKVYLVSGGFRQMINPIADILGIDKKTEVFANNILFQTDGSYAGFDEKEPTSRAGGKEKVIQMLKDKFGYETVVMVGDGATDMEARPPADAFIGYGGVAVRAAVKEGADWFVSDFQEVIDVLE
eukprot:jgi/Bigna1/53491/estExt_Genewise1Plus.C_200069